jgi:hypothetical protein
LSRHHTWVSPSLQSSGPFSWFFLADCWGHRFGMEDDSRFAGSSSSTRDRGYGDGPIGVSCPRSRVPQRKPEATQG